MSNLLDLILDLAMILIGLIGLTVRRVVASAMLFMVGGLGLAFLTEQLMLGRPADYREDFLDWRFYLAWMLLFVLIQVWLRFTSLGRRADALCRRFWDRRSSRHKACLTLEEGQFNYSLEASAEWARERRERRLPELFGDEGPVANDRGEV